MQSQAACAVMHPQFNLIYLSKLLSLYCKELWERISQFHRLLCLECFYGLLHTKTSIGIYKQMNNDHSCWAEDKPVVSRACAADKTQMFACLAHVYFCFLLVQSLHLKALCKQGVISLLSKQVFSASVVIVGLAC